MTKHLADPDCYISLLGFCPSNLLSPCLPALDTAVLGIVLDILPGDGPTVESLMMEVRGLQTLLCQRDEEFNVPERQVQELTEKLQEERSSSNGRQRHVRIDEIRHRDRLHEAFKRAIEQLA